MISLFFLPLVAASQLEVANIFSDNMVLQRGQPIHVWGQDIPGKQVTVLFAKQSKIAIVKADSSWNVYFKKQKANSVPQTIQIENDKESIKLNNILIGDIWLCSGQSNMEWMMKREMHWEEEKLHASQPLIRF